MPATLTPNGKPAEATTPGGLKLFARQATIDAFGWHFARALDQSTFVDRAPGQFPHPSPETRSR